jgi:hypothetical protein
MIQAHVSVEDEDFGRRLEEEIQKKLEPARKAKENERLSHGQLPQPARGVLQSTLGKFDGLLHVVSESFISRFQAGQACGRCSARTMKRPVESLQDFKARIAAIIGDKSEHVTGARHPHPLIVRKKRVIKTQKRRRR